MKNLVTFNGLASLRDFIAQIESCDYSCEAGVLENNAAWISLVAFAAKDMEKTCGNCSWKSPGGSCRRVCFGQITENGKFGAGGGFGAVYPNDRACPAFELRDKLEGK